MADQKVGTTKQPTVGDRGTSKSDMPHETGLGGDQVVGERDRTSEPQKTGDRAGDRQTSGGAKNT